VTAKVLARYHIRADAACIEARARTIAVEQSVEMPVEAIDDPAVLGQIVGRVGAIEDLGGGLFAATIALDVETTGFEPGQLLNMLFGNTSIHEDVTLAAIAVPDAFSSRFPGPRHGPDGLRARAGAGRRALTCSALKPQGLPPAGLAALAHKLALGGLDYIKDDHGLANQSFSPYAARVPAIAAAVRDANKITGRATRYLPSLSGTLDALRQQVGLARDSGLDTVLIAPMITGLATFEAIVRENPDFAFIAHPAMAGAARVAPDALLGTLFRLFGADGVIFPSAGGRFGYSAATCRAIADAARAPFAAIRPSLPVPAGGMTIARVPEILDFYGADAMLLIGGDLLAARGRMTPEASGFQRAVETFTY
jgi:ribulose-bisphosphate carboxylase large chain